MPGRRAWPGYTYILFIGFCVTRGCGDHSPLTTAAILEWRRRSAWGVLQGGAAAARRGLRGVASYSLCQSVAYFLVI